jgi:RNA polymerase sigma-70 factor, ECF subfamily
MTVTSIPWTKEAGLPGDVNHSLIERAFGGDQKAFAQVVEIHQPYVTRLAHRLLGWDPEVEDVVQDVFTRAWERRRQLRQADKLRSWLAAITVNAARSRLRRRMLWRAMLTHVRSTSQAESCKGTVVGGSLEREETDRLVRETVSALPQRDKEVLVLRYLEHMTVDEVATAMGLRVNAVEVRLHRARRRLAQRLPRELKP